MLLYLYNGWLGKQTEAVAGGFCSTSKEYLSES